MKLRVGINGFGRIGRQVYKIGRRYPELEFVAVNDLVDSTTLAHLLKYDSVFGRYEADVRAEGSSIVVDGEELAVLSVRDPGQIPWEDFGVDVVVEATGVFRSRSDAAKHLRGSVRNVVITAPAKGEPADYTVVMGVNHDGLDPERHQVISNASCTTNAFAIMVKVIKERFGIERGLMTTVHAYTNDQRILDAPHRDLRRARAAALSIIPTSTGAAKAIELIFPELRGKLAAIALRVPTPDVSIVDFSVEVSKETNIHEVNRAFEEASRGELSRYLAVVHDPVVSVDLIGDEHSVVIDPALTQVVEGRFIKVFGWYDNEWGYSARVVDLLRYIGEKRG